jgi:hypothetical protein
LTTFISKLPFSVAVIGPAERASVVSHPEQGGQRRPSFGWIE